MTGRNGRTKLGRWTGAVLLLLAVAFLVARVLPSREPRAASRPSVDADLPTYRPEAAAEHVGEVARVCGTVQSASWARQVEGRPTFLNLGRPYPDQPFTVVIWGRDRGRFGAPERRFGGLRICVAGKIRLHEGTAQIEVGRPAQIELRDGTGGRPAP